MILRLRLDLSLIGAVDRLLRRISVRLGCAGRSIVLRTIGG
jgi:hypothetical protein